VRPTIVTLLRVCTEPQITTEKLPEAVFSLRSYPKLYTEDKSNLEERQKYGHGFLWNLKQRITVLAMASSNLTDRSELAEDS
jgi:hypothetical protein